MRRAVLCLFLLVGLWAVAQAFPPLHPTGPTNAAVAVCRESPTADCLLDIGVDVLMAEWEPSLSTSWAAPLAATGRLDRAIEISAQHAVRKGATPQEADLAARKELADQRLLHLIRSGHAAGEAVTLVPEAIGVDIWLVGLALLGRDPYGLPDIGPRIPPTREDLANVSALATAILELRDSEPQRVSAWQLYYPANLFAYLGDPDGVMRALRAIEKAASEEMAGGRGEITSSGEALRGLNDEVYELAGPEAVLRLADLTEPRNAILLERAALAETDDAHADELLRRAFEIHATKEIWPDTGDMLRVIGRAIKRERLGTARALADRMVDLARIDHGNPFALFDHIEAAQALLDTGASRDEVLAELERAQGMFPSDPDEVVAVGFVAGPMQWEGFGLADEARGRVARIRASVGDLDGAIALLGTATKPVQVWGSLADLNLPVRDLDRLVTVADQTLSPDEALSVVTNLAALPFLTTWGPEQDAWAWSKAQELGRDPDTLSALDGRVARMVFGQAAAHGDVDLARMALQTLARIALDKESAPLLVQAGHIMASLSAG